MPAARSMVGGVKEELRRRLGVHATPPESETGGEASLLEPVPATLTAATAKRSDEAPDGARACRWGRG